MWREVGVWALCLMAGHRWKSSWRPKPHKDAILDACYKNPASVPYRLRQEGNPGCEYSAGWHYKCRRCRLRTRSEPWYPWWAVIAWAVVNWWRAYRISLGCWWEMVRPKPVEGRSYERLLPRGWVAGLGAAHLWAAGQGFGYFAFDWRWFPGWLLDLIWTVEERLRRVESRHTENWVWRGPQPPYVNVGGVLHIGAWQRVDDRPIQGGATLTTSAETYGSGQALVVHLDVGPSEPQ